MSVEIAWSPLARTRLQEIRAFVALDKPDAAERLAIRIVALVEALRNSPYLGRTGVEPGTRELVVGGTPFIIPYRIRGDKLLILTIWHGAQRKCPPRVETKFSGTLRLRRIKLGRENLRT